jgi:copper(I)-binding protein
MRVFKSIIFATAVVCGSSMSAFAQVKIENAWVRATPGTAKVSAGYADLVNVGEASDQLISVTSPLSSIVELHESKIENGVMSMESVGKITVPGMTSVSLKPGGYHIMIMQLSKSLKAGDKLPLKFTFTNQGDVTVDAIVAPIGATKAP